MNLRNKLIILFVFISMTAGFLVGYFAYRNSQQTIGKLTFNHLTSTTILKEAEYKRWIAQNKIILEALARRPLVRKFAEVLVTNSRDKKDIENANRRLLEDHLYPTLEAKGGYLDLSILHRDNGLILVSTEPGLENKYRETELFFVEGKTHIYVGDVIYSLSLEQPVMHISTPIKDKGGDLIAVLAGHVDWREMSNIMLQGLEMSGSEETYLVNRFNFFVSESRFRPDYFLKKAIYTKGVTECLAGNNGVGLYDDYRGTAVIGAYRWLSDHDLCILTEIDQAEALEPIFSLRRIIFGITVGVAFAVAVIGVLLARTITRPVGELVTGAMKFGQGNLKYRITLKRKDEIGQLAQSFNQMAENLQKITVSHIELENEVRERQKAEIGIRKERDRAQTYLDIAGVMIIALNEQEEVALINQKGCQILGYEQNEILGKKWFNIYLPESEREQTRTVFRKLMRGETEASEYYENSVLTKAGHKRLLAWHNTVLQDSNNQVVGTLSSGEDITERRQTENALRQSEERLRKVLANMPVMLDAFDENLNICLWNRQCELVTGFSAKEMIGRSDALKMLYPDEEYFNQMMAKWADRSDDYLNWEWDITCKNGEKRTVAWSNISDRVPIPGWKTWGIGVDVTERNEAQDAVEASLREKEILLQEVHHRVKNNLQMINSLLNLQSVNVEQNHYVEIFKESQNRIKSMALLHEKLYKSSDLARINFRKYVEELSAGLFRSYGMRQDRVSLQIEVDDILIGIDSAISCGLIINELVSNSLKHAFPGNRNGCIKILLYPIAGDKLKLKVEDNGIGWPQDLDKKAAETLGIRIIVMLAEDELNGTVEFKQENGARCVVRFARAHDIQRRQSNAEK